MSIHVQVFHYMACIASLKYVLNQIRLEKKISFIIHCNARRDGYTLRSKGQQQYFVDIGEVLTTPVQLKSYRSTKQFKRMNIIRLKKKQIYNRGHFIK